VKRVAWPTLFLVALTGCASARTAPAQRPHVGVPRGFAPEAFSAVSERNLWVLGSAPCRAGRCTVIVRTSNGGRTFAKTGAPNLPVSGYTPSILFADKRNGFAFVPNSKSALYATHDEGATWRRQALGGVLALATTSTTAYAVTAHCSADRCSHFRVETAPASSTIWTASRMPFTPDSGLVGLIVRGSHVWLFGTPRGNERRLNDWLARSADSGRTWSSGPGPCYADLGGQLIPASTRIVWAVCPTGMAGRALRSTDGAASFTPLRIRALVNSAQLTAASGTTAVLFANGAGSRLVRTTDGGTGWKPAHTPGTPIDVFSMAFIGSRVGFALVQTRPSTTLLWRTTDGGGSWSELRLR
jgi:photosystem II stability/assembly factor-like uncharacterized protein